MSDDANPVHYLIIGQCDGCGANNRALHGTISCGTETWACRKCYGDELDEESDDIRDSIDSLSKLIHDKRSAEHLVLLEAALREALSEIKSHEREASLQ